MPDGMSLEQWRAKKAQAKPSVGMSLDQWRAAKSAPVAPPATSPQLQDPIASALGGGVDPTFASTGLAEEDPRNRTPEQRWADRATRQVAGAHDINRDRIEQQYGGLGTKVGTALASAAAAPVRAIADPIAQGFEKGTALGIGGGLARGAFGGLMAATPIGNAFIQAGNASAAAQESERMGLDVPVLGRIGAAPSMPFEAAAHALPDFEKMRQESRRLGMPGAEALSEVGQLANEALPIAVLGGVHQGIANEVGLRRGIVAPPVPEQLPGTQVGRLRGARPAHVAAPVAPSMRPVPPNVTQTTGVRAASPEMAAELRASNVPLETPAIPAPAPVVETVPGRLRTSKPAQIDAPAGPVAEPQLSPGEAALLAERKFGVNRLRKRAVAEPAPEPVPPAVEAPAPVPAPEPVKPAPVAEVAPKQPEPAQAPPASEKVPTISDKAAPTPEPTSLWREMHPDEALSVVDPSVSVGRGMSNVPPERFVATDRSLALGQGANAGGVVVEFDPAGMNVRTPKARKPGADFVESTGGGGERILVGDEGTIRPNVRSVTVPRGKVRSGAQVRMTRMLERDGWTKEVNADKTVTYRRPAVEAKPASPELPPPAEPAPAPKVEAPAPASVPEIPETSAPAPSPQRAFIDRFVQATREGKTEDAAAEYRLMSPSERTKVHETLVADGLWKRGDGFSLPAIKAHADRVVAAEKAAAAPEAPAPGKLRTSTDKTRQRRPVGEAISDEEWGRTQPRKGHVYRGMEPAEFDNTVGRGRGVESKYAGTQEEGTSFYLSSDASMASGNAVFGDTARSTPREFGYVVEAKRSPHIHMRGGIVDPGEIVGFSETPLSDVTRVWEVRAKYDSEGKIDYTWHEVPKEHWPTTSKGSVASEPDLMKDPRPAKAKPYGVNKGKLRRGGKQSGEIVNPVAASEGVYDAADAAGGKLLRSAASAVRENVPGVDKVVTAAEGIRDKWFKSDAANVGPEYLAAKGERRGVEGLGVEHAGRAVKAVDKALRKASPEDVEGVYRYMNGESDALPASLAHRKALFDAVSSEIKSLGSQLVERGLMSQESFDQYVRYLPRLYETKGKLFGGGSDAPRIRETFLREDAPGFKFKAGDYAIIEETARKHGGYAFTEKHGTRAVKFPTVEARDAAYAEVSEALRGQKSRLNQQATGEIRKGEVGQAKMLHRDSMETPSASRMIEKFDAIKPEVLKELGEITDPRAPIQQAIQNAHAKIAADTFFKAVAEGSDAKGPWAVELPRDGYTHIDAQWAGKLRGKYVRNDILPDIQGDFNADKAGFARGWINQWKANKTVWSPRTAARQWFGNPFFMHIAGVDPMNPANWKAIKKAATALHPDSPLRRELVREGVIGPHDFAHIELPTDRAPNMAYRLGQAAANPLMLFRFGRNAQMRMGKVYGSADLLARASIYFRNKELGLSERNSSAEVRKWTPNYDEVGRATKLLKNSVIGSPFATYSHETLRIVGQALKDHPVRLGTGLLTLAAVQKAFDMAGADDVTEDERKAIEQQRGSQELVIGRDSEGRPLTFGAQYINPIGSLAPKASRLGDDALTNAGDYAMDVTGVAQSPLVDTLATMSRGEDRYGRKTSPRAATGYERVMGALEAYGRQVAPGLTPGLGGNYAQVEAAAKGEQLSDRIPKQTLQQAIVSAILGIDVRPFDVGLEKRNLSKQMEGRISSIESDRNTALRESKGKDKDAAPTAVEKMKDTVQDFRARSGVLRKASPPKKDTLPSPQEKP